MSAIGSAIPLYHSRFHIFWFCVSPSQSRERQTRLGWYLGAATPGRRARNRMGWRLRRGIAMSTPVYGWKRRRGGSVIWACRSGIVWSRRWCEVVRRV
ncbi:hypothetical protein M0R45_009069 [Rubus argutus]|uniref:Uncharacterized protein n=1 Tax=Rubus argutus TaxID=59490 RepID=A0AAW1Y3I5_RUBAR